MTSATEAPIARQLATFAAAPLDPEHTVALADDMALRMRDLIGISLAALGSEPALSVAEVIEAQGGAGQAELIGVPGRHPASMAALHNGTLAHALDFDDTHLPSVLHPSAPVLPAALATAQAVGADGRRLVHAAAVGEEICIRLGLAGYDAQSRDSVFFEKGLHATSICGTIGAAASAAVLRGLDAGRIEHALAIAASFGAGIIEANRTGGSIKRVHCGWAAHAGIMAADLAAAGLTGPPTVFEGRFGFFRAFCDDRVDLEVITQGLGERWEVLGLFYKPYPCNHFTQAGVDAALELRRRGISPEQIASVRLGVPGNVLRTIAEPPAEKASPPTGYTARFSGPFTFATALVGGGGLGVHLDDFTDEQVREPRRLALAAKVRCEADPVCDEIFPHQFPTIARVQTVDGEEITLEILHNRGGPGNPLSPDELARKFQINAERVLDGEVARSLSDTLARLPELTDLSTLLAPTHAAVPHPA
jgi:2-methylcitrate dehydratase PrpD